MLLRRILIIGALQAALWPHADGAGQDIAAMTVSDTIVKAVAEPVAVLERHRFNEAALQAYRADPALEYDRPAEEEEPGWWERFKQWFADLLRSIFGTGPGGFIFSHLLWILIVSGALVFLITALLRGGFTSAFRGRPRTAGTVSEVHEELHAEDLDALVLQAEEAREWRRAIRLRYLQVLRTGIDSGLLHWRPEYTDRDYARQLGDPARREAFTRIAFTFQWVWYGEAQLDMAKYTQLTAPFEAFISKAAA